MKSRAVAALCGSVLSLALLAGCSDGIQEPTEDISPPGPPLLNIDEAESILLTTSDVGEEFKAEEPIPDLESDTTGCLGIFDQAQTNQQFEVESQFASDEGVTVSSQVTSYASFGEPSGDINRFRKAARSCTQISEIRQGGQFDLDLQFNDEVTTELGEDQLNVLGEGTVTRGVESELVSFRYTVSRIKNNVVGVLITSIGENPDELDQLIEFHNVMVERLAEVAGEAADPDSEELDETEDPSESPTTDDSEDTEPSESPSDFETPGSPEETDNPDEARGPLVPA